MTAKKSFAPGPEGNVSKDSACYNIKYALDIKKGEREFFFPLIRLSEQKRLSAVNFLCETAN